jgi:hypothetical protein
VRKTSIKCKIGIVSNFFAIFQKAIFRTAECGVNNKVLRKCLVGLGTVIIGLTFLVTGSSQVYAASTPVISHHGAASHPTFSFQGGYAPIHSFENPNYCLGITNGSTAEGASTIIWACNGNNDQSWSPEYVGTDGGGNYYHIVNLKSGQCMGLYNGTTQEGTTPIQWACNGNADQQWYVPISGNLFNLVNRNSGLYLGIWRGNIYSGATLVQWPSNGSLDQVWF